MGYNLILIPEGSSLPEDLTHLFRDEPDVIQKIMAGGEEEVVVAVSTRELQMIVEYRDLFDLECLAVIGLQGAMYNTVWNTYVSTMKRVTVDDIRLRMKEKNDASARSGSAAIVKPTIEDRARRVGGSVRVVSDEDETDFTDDGAA